MSPDVRTTVPWLDRKLARAGYLAHDLSDGVRQLGRPESRVRTAAFQIAKSTAAAVIAWWVADPLLGSETAWLPPMTAVLMVHSTVYRSMVEGLKRVVAVAAGVGIAAAAGNLIGLSALGLAVVVPLSLLGARLRWMRTEGEYIAVTAVILLTFGMSTQEQLLLSYVRDTGLGAVIGAAVNMLLFPPAYQRSARAAVDELASEAAGVARKMADGLGEGWGPDTADRWRRDADSLQDWAEGTESTLGWSRESQRWNPWPKRDGKVSPDRYEPAVETLWHVAIEMRALADSLGDATEVDALTPPLRDDLVPMLESVAEVVRTYGADPLTVGGRLSPEVAQALDRASERFDDLAQRMPAMTTEGALLEAAGSVMRNIERVLGHLRQSG